MPSSGGSCSRFTLTAGRQVARTGAVMGGRSFDMADLLELSRWEAGRSQSIADSLNLDRKTDGAEVHGHILPAGQFSSVASPSRRSTDSTHRPRPASPVPSCRHERSPARHSFVHSDRSRHHKCSDGGAPAPRRMEGAGSPISKSAARRDFSGSDPVQRGLVDEAVAVQTSLDRLPPV